MPKKKTTTPVAPPHDVTLVPTSTLKRVEVTEDGLGELKRELKELIEVKLPASVDRVAKAREYGDLSENAEYHSARDDQELLQARIAEIEEILVNAKVVKHTLSTSKVGMGSVVTVSIKGKKKQLSFHIVGEFETDPTQNKISSVSPLGLALMNKKRGDVVTVNVPAGQVEYVIEEIK